MSYTINIKGRLLDLTTPQVMGILNVTPDSFYAGSRVQTEAEIVRRCHQIVDEGATMIDVGGYSTRPGGTEVSEAEEMERLRFGLSIIRRELPDAIISVDTFRTDVARMTVEEFGADIINDVSEGNETMYRMVERLHVMELPLLVGISRKSMIYKLMGITPEESLNGTTVLNTISLMKGAHILRVHDVKQAVECVKIMSHLSPLTSHR